MVEGIRGAEVFRGFDRTATRMSGGPITLIRNEKHPSSSVRVAFAIPRRVGSAVVRNRLRRQIRALVDQTVATEGLPAGAYLIVVKPDARGSEFSQLRAWFDKAAQKMRDHG